MVSGTPLCALGRWWRVVEQRVAVRLTAENASYLAQLGASVRETDRLTNAVQRLDRQARALDRRPINITARLDTSSWDEQTRVAAERLRPIKLRATLDLERIRDEVRGLGSGPASRVRVRLRAGLDTSGWQATALLAASRVKVTVTARLGLSRNDLNARIRGDFAPNTKARLQSQLNQMRLRVLVRPEIDAGDLDRRLGRGGSGGGGGGIGVGGAIAARVAGIVSLLPQAVSLLSAATGGATALAGQLGLAASAAGGIVPVVGALGQAVAAVKLGTGNVTRLLDLYKAYTTALAEGDTKAASKALEKYNERLAETGKNQGAFVRELIASKAAYIGVRDATGEALFTGLDESLRLATRELLPLFREQLVDTASIVNRTGRGLVADLAGPLSGPLAGALRLNNDLLLKASPLVGRLVSIALSLYNAAGPLAGRILDSANSLARLGEASATAGLESGRLTGFFDRAGNRAGSLLTGLGNLGRGMADVFRIGNEGSAGLLPGFEQLTARFATFTSSVRGEEALRRWFTQAEDAGVQLRGLFADIGREFGGISANVSAAGLIGSLREAVPFARAIVDALSGDGQTGRILAQSLRDIVETLDRANAGGALRGFIATLSTLVGIIADVVEHTPGASAALGFLATALGSVAAVNLVAGGFLRLAPALAAIATPAGAAAAAVGLMSIALFKSREDVRATEEQIRKLANLPAIELIKPASVEASRAGLQAIIDRVGVFRDSIAADGTVDSRFAQAQRDAEKARVALDELNRSEGELTATASRLGGELGLTNEQLVDLAVKANVDLRTASYEEAREKIAEYKAETGGAAIANQQLAADLATMGDASVTAGEKADALRRILEGLDAGTLGANEAAIRFRESMDALSASAAQNGTSLDINTAAGRANQSAIIDAKRALDDRIVAEQNAGVSGKQLEAIIRDGSAELARQTEKAFGTTDQTRKLNEQYGLTPAKVQTRIDQIGMDEAQQKLQRYNEALNTLLQRPGMTKVVAERLLAPREARPAGFAHDGSVPGSSPHKRADNVPIMATAGEYVHDVDAVQHYGQAFMDDVNARRFPKRAARGYANGGLVVTPGLRHTIDPAAVEAVYGAAVRDMQAAMAARMEPSQGGSSTGLIPIMAAARAYTMREYGVRNIGGFARRNIAGTNQLSDHGRGKAIDIMIGPGSLGNAIAEDFAHGSAGRMFKAENVIWQQAISSRGGPFRGMRDRGSPTQNHRDHVHVDTFDGGGRASGRGLMFKDTIRPERVLSSRQTVSFERLVDRLEAPQVAAWLRAPQTAYAPPAALATPPRALHMTGDLYLDSGEFLGKVHGVVDEQLVDVATAIRYGSMD